ncbi:oxygen-dependent coproporphyrinogen oxidase [Fulvivirga lutimaris]|uniref:oxygen-dependent coproporphyrinogen oxidase n=1 Tax=Fulvivirga lutimaris TaxID=1819566 RepID=UPI0012BCEA67|nr:oxygen-dependent coproporphyrinogen oxidase [Fulvivirga lutimaris]MTI38841.1 oxygen-dependent coproporphyrinogen oxidase [Fulvivirga lutimaris]
MPTKDTITEWFKQLQDEICAALKTADGKGTFKEDAWEREQGGGGRSRVLTEGNIIEKGGVNFSAVHGQLSSKISDALKLPASDFYATGVSIVLHPKSPMVPIIHMNVRYFETVSKSGESTWWFGGGIDLTPHYVVKEDAQHFHTVLKEVCDKHDASYYPKFKEWADEYFFIKHRNETRGIGGIFFDRLNESTGKTKEELFAFVKDVGQTFAPIYTHFMAKNSVLPYTEQNELWQKVRRGRYVEFNLVWDKGTKFGLDTDGRTESILMSLPPQANWIYDHQPEAGSNEMETLQLLKKGINWVS